MVGGFNHNFNYKGHTYHVQTEDSGGQRAQITTLLYRAGSIIARVSTNYADISTAPDLAAQVEERMKDQHRAMLKKLKDGGFDAKILQLDQPKMEGLVCDKSQDSSAEPPVAQAEQTTDGAEEKQAQPAAPATPAPEPGGNVAGPAALEAVLRDYLNAGRS